MPAFVFSGGSVKGFRPGGLSHLNRASAQANALAMFCPLPQMMDLVRGMSLQAGVLAAPSVLPLIAGGVDGAATQYVTASVNGCGLEVLPTNAVQNVTSAIWAFPTSTATEQVLLNIGIGTDGWALEIESSNWKLLINGLERKDTGVAVTLNAPALIAARRAGTTWQVFLNGRPIGTTTTTTPNVPTLGFSIGYQSGGSSRAYTGRLWHAATWTRALTDSEMWSLYDPATRWDLYWVPGRRVFFDVGAAFNAALFPYHRAPDFIPRRETMTPSGRVA